MLSAEHIWWNLSMRKQAAHARFIASPEMQRLAKNWSAAQRKLGMSFAQAAENLSRSMAAFAKASKRLGQ